MKLFNKYFWILSYLIYLLVAFVSYGFIKDLYFRNEDFGNIYHFLFGGVDRAFPYQGIKYVLYPLYLLFGNQPSGYFQVAFFLYTLLPLFLAFVIWKYTNNKFLAFITGLLFATGYIGSESKLMIELAIPEIMYLFSLLGVLVFYKNYIDFHSVRSWIIAFTLYSLAIIFISQRAYSFVFIVFITDLLLTLHLKSKSWFVYITGSIKRMLPFIFTFVGVYIGIPLYLHENTTSYLATNWIWQSRYVFTIKSYLIFLSDVGNFIIPSFFQEKIVEIFLQKASYNFWVFVITVLFTSLLGFVFVVLKSHLKNRKLLYAYWVIYLLNFILLVSFSEKDLYLLFNSYLGLFLIYFILGILIFIKMNKFRAKLLSFFMFSWLTFSLVFHLNEALWIHPSFSRYLTAPFIFFSSIVAIILVEVVTLSENKKMLRVISYGIFIITFSSYLLASYLSPDKKFYLDRSYQLKYFISSLKDYVPHLVNDKSLFYFDVVDDAETMNMYASFLITGTFTDETALATFYKHPRDQIKIVKDYDSFLEEKDSGFYKNTYVFFYDINKKLHNLTTHFQYDTNLSLTIDDFTKANAGLLHHSSGGSYIEVKNNKLQYESKVIKNINGSSVRNEILELKIDDFDYPAYKPVRLDITLTGSSLVSTIDNYPYRDGSVPEIPDKNYLKVLEIKANIHSILNYIKERERFRKLARVQSSGDYYPYNIQDVIDGHLDTSWKPWFGGQPAWIKVSFPQQFTFSEVRWITTEANPPTAYEYQISEHEEGPWETILSVTNPRVKTGEYVVDKIPTTAARYFRMVFSEFNVDSPFNADNPTIAEFELLNTASDVDSRQADFLLIHPLAFIVHEAEMQEITNIIQDHLYIGIYPITDKYLEKKNAKLVKRKISLDGRKHTYSFILPPGGTKIKSLLLEFPNIPIFILVEKISLTQADSSKTNPADLKSYNNKVSNAGLFEVKK